MTTKLTDVLMYESPHRLVTRVVRQRLSISTSAFEVEVEAVDLEAETNWLFSMFLNGMRVGAADGFSVGTAFAAASFPASSVPTLSLAAAFFAANLVLGGMVGFYLVSFVFMKELHMELDNWTLFVVKTTQGTVERLM